MVSVGHSTADSTDTAGTGCEGIDHDSTDWVVPGTSAGSLVEDWCADEYCFQWPIPEASSSWAPYALIVNNNSAIH